MIPDRNKVKNVTENPCNMCMPLGAIIPFKGIENCMVIIHGSQGCATYMRRHMAEHFNEPIDVASSSITEKGTIFGGENNLKRGLKNLIQIYKPEVVGILSTCLAETIGEDIERIAAAFQAENSDSPGLIAVATPGYGGSHAEGYFRALHGIVAALSRNGQKHAGLNVFVPHISPADIREIKRILELMQVEYTLLPDISATLDSPYSQSYKKIPPGGTSLAAIQAMAGARASIQFGSTVDEELSPGQYLETAYGVPLYNLPLPIGVEACDQFINLLKNFSGQPVPAVLQQERGRLLDAMVDSHKYNREGRAAVFGEPETVYAVSRLLVENGIAPVILATGSTNRSLPGRLRQLTAECDEEALILTDSDFARIRQHCSPKGINLAIGCSDGRVLTEKEGIPLVRLGFPIHDRVGGQRILSVGYNGSTILLDQLTNTLLADKLKNYRVRMYRRFYPRPASSPDQQLWRNRL
ncbi:MAG: nitrogenase component 1 [Syntrophomonadaceae bacterium]|nr:nitrogenase component 1 [Syntrophomonadaceae bacterium]